VLLAGFGFHGFPIVPALLFSLISAYWVVIGLDSQRSAHLLAAGAFVGIAALSAMT